MRRTLLFAAFCAALALRPAAAFDSDAWLARREAFACEAVRLQGVYSNYLAQVKSPALDVRIPLELFDNGRVKSLVIAKKAQYFLDTGVIWGEGVTIEQYKKDGTLELRLTADSCVADRNTRVAWVEGHAKATHRKTVLEGDGLFYSSKDEYLKISEKAVVVSEDVKMKGLKL